MESFKLIFDSISYEEFLLPIYNNQLLFLTTSENKLYIPLFTSKEENKEIKCTSYDKVKINKVINELYNKGIFHAIVINPFTDEFIIEEKGIKCINNLL